ncbi:MAG: prepilin-type N-terminal cleavage/methylation domain-containing protein [Deltaproteobacteria bacterium]|nr:prepilin-type N-terminal cleavage/methylation domain-containing protein [Deltaproteobacteria bacterium]
MSERKGKGIGFIINNKGFTLIEMAIVLIIIGIIIGAVVKGKDLVRSAEQKRLYSKFVSSWELAYNAYYDRTGRILGDTATDDNSGARDGHCSDPSEANLNGQLSRVGLEYPGAGPTGSIISRTYNDSQGRPNTITITFRYDGAQGNFIRMDVVPNELGMAWDRIIDGEMDGSAGDFLYIPNTADMVTAIDWPSAVDDPVTISAAILKLSF